jgi:hypothetical protein
VGTAEAAVARESIAMRALQRDWTATAVRGVRAFPVAAAAFVLYAVASTALLLTGGAAPSFTQLVFIAVVVAFFPVRARPLVWLVVFTAAALLLFFGLDSDVSRAAASVHVTPPVDIDSRLLGGHSVRDLQSAYLALPVDALLTPLLVLAYLSHWYGSVMAWVWLWLRHPQRMARFLSAFALVEVAGELIYLIYPEAPPWRAAQLGVLPGLQRAGIDWLRSLGGFGTWYAATDPEPLAAMPALHVAVPLLVSLTLIAASARRRAWLWLLYPAVMAFSVLVLGEHYLIDVIVAVLLGGGAFLVAEVLGQRWPRALGAGWLRASDRSCPAP